MNALLPPVPVVDVRAGGALFHARHSAKTARALRDACLGFLPRPLRPLVPALDWLSRRSLARSPYLSEIREIAALLDCSGVWLLNACYQWGCTALAGEQHGVPWLIRTLDWPFRGLGRYMEVVRMRGECGDFFSVTWPGYVGVLTAMAPRRFAACVNQAPMRRRTSHRWLRPYDFAANALSIWTCAGSLPPDQVLRRTFEVCDNYDAARRMLEQTPVARPVIYILVGCATRERCVIERTETGCLTRTEETGAANDWLPARPGWEGRIGADRFLSCSLAEAANQSRARCAALAGWSGSLSDRSFDWLREPVLNRYTRLAVAMSPARGILRAAGYDLAGAALPEPATQLCEIETMLQAA